MKREQPIQKSGIKAGEQYAAEPIEAKLRRMINNKEPLDDGMTAMTYTERSEGVKPEMDIRTDKWEIATDAMDHVTQAKHYGREMKIGEKTFDTMNEDQKKEFHKKFPKNKFNQGDGKTESPAGQ